MNDDNYFQIPGHPNYVINKNGEIINLSRMRPVKPFKQTGKYGGYLRVNLDGKAEYVHRLIVETFCSELYNQDIKYHVAFKDGDRGNVSFSNLQIVFE